MTVLIAEARAGYLEDDIFGPDFAYFIAFFLTLIGFAAVGSLYSGLKCFFKAEKRVIKTVWNIGKLLFSGILFVYLLQLYLSVA